MLPYAREVFGEGNGGCWALVGTGFTRNHVFLSFYDCLFIVVANESLNCRIYVVLGVVAGFLALLFTT